MSEKQEELHEMARQFIDSHSVGALSTHSLKHEGFPFGSVMPYGLDSTGQPVFLISSMAVHSKNLRADPRATLLVTETGEKQGSLGSGRATLMGTVESVPEDELAAVRESYLQRHPDANQWVNFGDFEFVRLKLVDVYFVGGFGVMGWLGAV